MGFVGPGSAVQVASVIFRDATSDGCACGPRSRIVSITAAMAGGTFVSAYGVMQFLKRFFGANETREELFLFVHVPKTGGQTLRDCFIRQLVFHLEFIHLGPDGEQKSGELRLLPIDIP